MEKKKEFKSKPVRCVVVSDKMTKSRVAVFTRLVQVAKYKKHVKRRTRLMFHDEKNTTSVGDEVLVRPSKPFSKLKCFELIQVVKKGRGS